MPFSLFISSMSLIEQFCHLKQLEPQERIIEILCGPQCDEVCRALMYFDLRKQTQINLDLGKKR